MKNLIHSLAVGHVWDVMALRKRGLWLYQVRWKLRTSFLCWLLRLLLCTESLSFAWWCVPIRSVFFIALHDSLNKARYKLFKTMTAMPMYASHTFKIMRSIKYGGHLNINIQYIHENQSNRLHHFVAGELN